MRRLVLAVLLLLVCLPLAAEAQAPSAQGWWSALNRQGLPASPAPPDVGPDDLLVQGGDVVAEIPGLPQGQPQPTAVAALRFVFDPGGTVTSLDLPVKELALVSDVRAYPAAERFMPAQNGTYELAPDLVLGGWSQGLLSADGTVLSFPDIARLVRTNGELSIVLVAGLTDRVVLTKPGEKALSVTPAREPAPPAAFPPTVAPGPVFEPRPQPTAPAFGPLSPPTGEVPAVVQTPELPQPAAAAPVIRHAAASTDDGRTRLMVLIEAVLVFAFFGLLGYGPFGRLSRFTGLGTSSATAVRGVGRFRTERTGKPPSL